jgi:hypothetical protein
MTERTLRCRGCHRRLQQQAEKAIGSGEYAMVWANLDGEWVCPKTGNEHEPNRDRENR